MLPAQRAALLSVMAPSTASLQAALQLSACGHLCGSAANADGSLLPTPTSILDAHGHAGAFPPSPPNEEEDDGMDFLVASSPGSQSCVGESSGQHVLRA